MYPMGRCVKKVSGDQSQLRVAESVRVLRKPRGFQSDDPVEQFWRLGYSIKGDLTALTVAHNDCGASFFQDRQQG